MVLCHWEITSSQTLTLRHTPTHTRTHTSYPWGVTRTYTLEPTGPSSPAKPRAWETPDAQIHTNTHSLSWTYPQANTVAEWAGCCNNCKSLTLCAAIFLLITKGSFDCCPDWNLKKKKRRFLDRLLVRAHTCMKTGHIHDKNTKI